MMVGVVLSSQAQIGNLVGRAIKKKVEQTVEKKMEDALGLNNESVKPAQTPPSEEKERRMPTAEEVMGMVPQLPNEQQVAEYLCESNRAKPRTLKMLANPTTAFLTKMVAASASGYAVTMSGSKQGTVYNYDEQLLKEFGITQEQFDAMSEEEQKEMSVKFASELQDRYLRTAEYLSNDKTYRQLMDEYNAVEKRINTMYEEADLQCNTLWKNEFSDKDQHDENMLCSYFDQAVPVLYKAVIVAMQLRKEKQLPIAKKMDDYVQELARKNPEKVYAGFYNQGGLCATSYISDAARLTTITKPL